MPVLAWILLGGGAALGAGAGWFAKDATTQDDNSKPGWINAFKPFPAVVPFALGGAAMYYLAKAIKGGKR